MENLKVCAIIVTYNRKALLARCIQSVQLQSYMLNSILVIDNASTDASYEFLVNDGLIANKDVIDETLIDVSLDKNQMFYYRTKSNIGGAGGFYTGLKIAREQNVYNAFWLMDDDGYPSIDCLGKQIFYLGKYDYVMPVSIDIDDHAKLSWATRKRNGKKTNIYSSIKKDWGDLIPFIFPFNGSLLSSKIVDRVGYINPDLFIWGDDYEHYYRCLKFGFTPVTLLDAIFYHPVNKASAIPILFGIFQVPYVDSKLKFICLIRNWAFIYKKNRRCFAVVKSFFAYTWLFLITRKMDISGYKLYLVSTLDGFREDFTRHLKYLK